MRADLLTKSSRFLRQKKYAEAIRMLEPNVLLYRDSFKYHYILAMACLYSGDFGGAFTYFKRAREIKPRDPSALLGFAALYMRRRETDRALDLYLETLDIDPNNKTAKKALKIIRKYSGTDYLSDWIDAGRFSRLYPPLPKVRSNPARIIVSLVCAVAVSVLAYGALIGLKVMPLPENTLFKRAFKTTPGRNGWMATSLDQEDRDSPVETGGSYRYILTRSQVLSMYEDARKLFTTYNDEKAKIFLNRIIESNASESIRTKAGLLISYMDVPGFDTLKDRISYREVMEDPVLYRDCYVIWRGMATNLAIEQNSTSFDFLVGYDTRTKLEGLVPTLFNFSVGVSPEKPLEILGKIVPLQGGDAIQLEGTAIHQIGILGR
ncbi:MAG: tetratricopeptide repeat protein [Treponema sp.]|jgi:tetratricopeptide (TPR) repeat protein|nr:tetratricopeptide repeat protein [Treponema sp.]